MKRKAKTSKKSRSARAQQKRVARRAAAKRPPQRAKRVTGPPVGRIAVPRATSQRATAMRATAAQRVSLAPVRGHSTAARPTSQRPTAVRPTAMRGRRPAVRGIAVHQAIAPVQAFRRVTMPVAVQIAPALRDAALAEFRAAARQARRTQWAALRYAWATAATLAEPPRQRAGPVQPQRSSRAELWAWYRARGKSWEQFEADHGPG